MAFPANYRDDVIDKKGADAALKGSEPRAYITWRHNYSDSDYFLSYNSVAFGVSHIPLLRLPDGYFRCLEGLEKTRYPSLGDFLSSRTYLQAPPAAGGDDAGAGTGTGGLVQRKRGGLGKDVLPRSIPLPKPRAPNRALGEDPPVPPTLSPPALNRLFAAVGVLSVVLSAWCAVEYRAHEALAVSQAGLLTLSTEEAMRAANTRLAEGLKAAGPRGAQDPAACAAAAAAWRDDVLDAQEGLQAALDAGDAYTFLRHSASIALVAFALGGALLCITTGRKGFVLPPDVEGMSDAEIAAAAAAVRDAAGGRGGDPPCTALQFRWTLAFLALVGTGVLASALTLQVLWLYGGPGQTVEYAAKPLCLRFGYNATDEHFSEEAVAAAAADAAAAAAAMGSVNTLAAQEGHPWRQGDYQAAVRTMGLSPACALALQPHVWGLDEMPALLRVPLGAVLPLPAFSVHALATHGHARAAEALRLGDDADRLVALADPFHGTPLVGWVDGDALVVPSHTGIAFATLSLLAGLMGAYAVLLCSAEAAQEQVPKLRRRCCGNAAGGRRGAQAAEASRSAEHRHAD